MKRRWIALLVPFAAGAQLAYAHSELSASVPADKATLAEAPKEVVLDFSEPVNLTALSLERSGEAKQSLGPLPAAAAAHFAIAAPALSSGDYVVDWRALSDDGHVMSGALHFTVGAAR